MKKMIRTAIPFALVLSMGLTGCGALGPQRSPSAAGPAPDTVLAGNPAQSQPEPKTAAQEEIQVGSVPIDASAMQAVQAQVDNGHQPGWLDPLQVAIQESVKFGFSPVAGDQFTLISRVEKGAGSGTGEATVEATHGGAIYRIQLIQPNGPGRASIWAVNSIQRQQ